MAPDNAKKEFFVVAFETQNRNTVGAVIRSYTLENVSFQTNCSSWKDKLCEFVFKLLGGHPNLNRQGSQPRGKECKLGWNHKALYHLCLKKWIQLSDTQVILHFKQINHLSTWFTTKEWTDLFRPGFSSNTLHVFFYQPQASWLSVASVPTPTDPNCSVLVKWTRRPLTLPRSLES